jgi:hypothetical protein
VLEDGRVLIAGGEVATLTAGRSRLLLPTTRVDIYDPSAGIWSMASVLLEGKRFHAAALMPDGRVMVVGDRDVEMYDPATDAWSFYGELKKQAAELHTGTQLKDGRILIVGGKDDTNEDLRGLTHVEIYAP